MMVCTSHQGLAPGLATHLHVSHPVKELRDENCFHHSLEMVVVGSSWLSILFCAGVVTVLDFLFLGASRFD